MVIRAVRNRGLLRKSKQKIGEIESRACQALAVLQRRSRGRSGERERTPRIAGRVAFLHGACKVRAEADRMPASRNVNLLRCPVCFVIAVGRRPVIE